MASDEIYEFTVNTPAGTLPSAPIMTLTPVLGRRVERVRWRLPAGALGVMGWRIASRSVQLIPKNPGGWIIANETSGEWELMNQHDSGDWSVISYNTGNHSHQIFITYFAQVIRPVPPEFALLDAASLGSAPSPDWTGE